MENPVLEFWYLNRKWGAKDFDKLRVHISTDEGLSFECVFETTTNHETWTRVVIPLPAEATEDSCIIAFEAEDGYGYGVALDDISVMDLHDANIFSLNYDANGGSGSGTEHYVEGENVTVAENTFTAPSEGMSFLCWNTKANGNGVSYFPGDEFVIERDVTLYAQWGYKVSSLLEGFENGIPETWTIDSNPQSYQWTSGTGDSQATTGAHGGEKNALITHVMKGAQSYLITPYFTVEGMQDAVLDFWYVNRLRSSDFDSLWVYYRTIGGEWQKLYGTTESHETWTNEVIPLPEEACASYIQIGFRAKDAYGRGIGLDDVSVHGLNTVLDVSLITSELPNGWTITSTCDDYRWTFEDYGAAVAMSNADCIGQTTMLISPLFNLSAFDFAELQFLYEGALCPSTHDNLKVYWREQGGDWVRLPFMMSDTEPVTASMYLPQEMMKAQVQIAFEATDCIVDLDPSYVALGSVKVTGMTGELYEISTFSDSDDPEACSITAPQYGVAGEEITLNVTIPSEYSFYSYAIKCGDELIDATSCVVNPHDATITFTMPEGNVSATAWFARVRRNAFFEDFESGSESLSDWTFVDADHDGKNWYCHYYNSVNTFVLYSMSVNPYTSAHYNPDNWAITPAIEIPKNARLDFEMTANYENNMRVYVGLDPDHMLPLSEELTTTTSFVKYTYDLSEYEGKTVYIGFRHHCSDCSGQICLDNIAVYQRIAADKDPVLMGYAKAALDGKIGLAFFVELPEWIKQDEGAYAILTQCDTEKKIFVSDIVAGGMNSDGLYRVPIYMPAAFYRENVNMRFYDGNGKLVKMEGRSSHSDLTATGVNYTLEKNVKSLKNSTDAKTKKLAIAIDDYCTAAQIFFEHPTEGVTLTLSSAVAGVTQAELNPYKSVRTGEISSRIEGISLNGSFESDCALKIGIFFKGDGKKKSGIKYYVQTEEGGALIPTTLHGNQSSGYYLAARNIPAAYLGKNYTFVIKDTQTNQTCSIACSLFTYVRASAFNATMSTDFQNLAKALYLYGKAAQDYFAME